VIQGVKNYLSFLIFKTMGTSSFTRRIEWRRLLAWLYPEEGERILDVACGIGELSLKIAKRGSRVYGIDMSEEAIKFARRLSKKAGIDCEFQIGNAENLPYPEGYFDKVVCSSALEHFHDDGRALQEMKRVLKPKGKLVLTVDSLTYPLSQALKNKHKMMAAVVHYYTREELEESLYHAGLEKCRSEYLLNSYLTSLFFKLWIKYKLPQVLWLLIGFIGYPAFLIADGLSDHHNCGYTLLAEARKVN
jgi:ubiquinone/menaquinone biosynthesis C-methylase UbiE